MTIVKCSKCGKWYNSDKFTVCPICNPNSIEQKPTPKKTVEESDPFATNLVKPRAPFVPERPEADPFSSFKTDDDPNNHGNTDSFWDNGTEGLLQNEVKRATASSAGKTVSVFQSMNKEREGKSGQAVDPTVGWLVCIGGPHLGETFAMHAGKNMIGRNEDNEIVLGNDSQVSREKHAQIIYEPRKRSFYLQPGDSRGLTYLNDEFISAQQLLKKGDLIELGGTKLLMIPLCGEDFSWDEYYGQGDRA